MSYGGWQCEDAAATEQATLRRIWWRQRQDGLRILQQAVHSIYAQGKEGALQTFFFFRKSKIKLNRAHPASQPLIPLSKLITYVDRTLRSHLLINVTINSTNATPKYRSAIMVLGYFDLRQFSNYFFPSETWTLPRHHPGTSGYL